MTPQEIYERARNVQNEAVRQRAEQEARQARFEYLVEFQRVGLRIIMRPLMDLMLVGMNENLFKEKEEKSDS